MCLPQKQDWNFFRYQVLSTGETGEDTFWCTCSGCYGLGLVRTWTNLGNYLSSASSEWYEISKTSFKTLRVKKLLLHLKLTFLYEINRLIFKMWLLSIWDLRYDLYDEIWSSICSYYKNEWDTELALKKCTMRQNMKNKIFRIAM